MILLIDNIDCSHNIEHYWALSRFLEKINKIGLPTVIWDEKNLDLMNYFPLINSSSQLFSFASQYNAKMVVYVEGTQLFLDSEVIKKGLINIKSENFDYFTQWEHCRLPVGIGCRVFSLVSMNKSNASNPSEYLNLIRNNPNGYIFSYDNEKYTSFGESLYDSRYSSAIMEIINHEDAIPSWNLRGFLSLLKKYPKKTPLYKNNELHFRLDERKMLAAYGFESPECADFPTYIMFDITNLCNAKCIHCPHSITYSQTRKKAIFLEIDIYKRVIDECVNKKLQFVRITADGEPLLHKGIIEMIDYASQKGVSPIGITTNGSLMLSEMSEKLINSGLFMIDFSLDAIKPKTYKKIRQGLPYNKVIRNIENFLELRAKKKSSIKVMVSFVKQEENQNELEEFKKKWQPIVDKVLIRECISNVNLIEIKRDQNSKTTVRWPCPHFFRRIVINYNGLIKACPIDWKNATTYKSLKETTIYDAWHSDYFWQKRMEHLNDKFSSDTICKNCKDWQGSPWELGYEKTIRNL